ncbi:MAG: hypothetical protein IPP47_16615 [Bryobacterales bacterium]|nr:hypothetical protein [Bryobacterales bacterium]
MRASLLLAAAALLVLPGCQRLLPTRARVDAAIAPLIPGDSVVLAGLRLDRLKGTPFYQKYVIGRRIPELDNFKEKTGIDATKDIWELVYAASPSRTLLFIRGKFGGEFGLEPNFALPGLQRMSHKGYYILYKGEDGVLFLNSGVAVAGKITDLQAVVDNRDKNAETPPVELLNLVKTLPADHAWLVSLQAGVMAQKLPDEGNAGNFARLAKSLGRVTLHADLASAISMEAEGEYPNHELARQVQDTIRAGIGILRLRTPDSEAAMLKVYDGIRVEARENLIQVKIDAPFDFIDALMKLQRAPAR